MALFQWGQGWEPFGDLERHVEQLLATMQQSFPALRVQRAYPPINLSELEHEFVLVAKVPGMSPAQLDLTVSDGTLTLRGERGRPEGASDDAFRRHERFWGRWERSVSLPERIIEDRITAEVSEGLLIVHLPKALEGRARQIAVSTGDGTTEDLARASATSPHALGEPAAAVIHRPATPRNPDSEELS